MAAATVDGTAAKNKAGDELIRQYTASYLQNKSPLGQIIPFAWKESWATTNIDDIGDILRISPKFPSETYIWGFRGTPTDGDTGGPAWVYDIIFQTEAGVTVATLVSASTKGQAASGTDVMLDAIYGKKVGAGYVAIKTTTASATPAAGSYQYGMMISRGVCRPQFAGVFTGDAWA